MFCLFFSWLDWLIATCAYINIMLLTLSIRFPQCQVIVEEVVTAMNKTFHPACFLCTKCGKMLGEGMFRVGDDSLVYCEEDWMDMFETRCDKCHTAIEELDKVIEIGGQTMHARCFCCAACQVSLDGKKFVTKNGKPFCKAHSNAPAIF